MKKIAMAISVVLSIYLAIGIMDLSAKEKVKPEEFYKGKLIDLSIQGSPGASTDNVARVAAIFFTKYLGARIEPNIRREAGGTESHSFVYRATPDGLTIGACSDLSVYSNEITEAPGVLYESTKFNWIGGIGRNPHVFVVALNGPYQSIAALQKAKKLKLGGTSLRGFFALGSATVAEVFGLDAKVIAGYTGANAMDLGIIQGELAGANEILPGYLRGKAHLKPLCILGTKTSPYLPGVPPMADLIKEDRLSLATIWSRFYERVGFFTSPGVDEDKVRYLRDAWVKMSKEPTFFEKMNLACGLDVSHDFMTGEEMQALVNEIMKDKTNLRQIFKQLIEKYRG